MINLWSAQSFLTPEDLQRPGQEANLGPSGVMRYLITDLQRAEPFQYATQRFFPDTKVPCSIHCSDLCKHQLLRSRFRSSTHPDRRNGYRFYTASNTSVEAGDFPFYDADLSSEGEPIQRKRHFQKHYIPRRKNSLPSEISPTRE